MERYKKKVIENATFFAVIKRDEDRASPIAPAKPARTEAPFAAALVEGDEPPSDCSPLLGFPFRAFLRCRDLLPRGRVPGLPHPLRAADDDCVPIGAPQRFFKNRAGADEVQ